MKRTIVLEVVVADDNAYAETVADLVSHPAVKHWRMSTMSKAAKTRLAELGVAVHRVRGSIPDWIAKKAGAR